MGTEELPDAGPVPAPPPPSPSPPPAAPGPAPSPALAGASSSGAAGPAAPAPAPAPLTDPAVAGGRTPQPAAVINLVDQPELEVPEAFGRTVAAAQSVASAGTPPAPPPLGASGAPPSPSDGGDLSEAKIVERPYTYDPEESRDTTRQTITLWLIGLLCAIVVLAFVALFASGVAAGFTGPTFFEGLKKILDVLVGPVITLLASAVGFYFGSKQGESAGPAKTPGKTTP